MRATKEKLVAELSSCSFVQLGQVKVGACVAGPWPEWGDRAQAPQDLATVLVDLADRQGKLDAVESTIKRVRRGRRPTRTNVHLSHDTEEAVRTVLREADGPVTAATVHARAEGRLSYQVAEDDVEAWLYDHPDVVRSIHDSTRETLYARRA
jgi:hypothetical protein